MINYKQFREDIVIPTLEYLEPDIPYSEEAVDLLMLTAAHESRGGRYLKQIGGPALGVYQMEPATERDIHLNYLGYNSEIELKVQSLEINLTGFEDLVFNLAYATAMARVHYYRVPEALPRKDKYVEGEYITRLAVYAKEYYNTRAGKAKTIDYYEAFIDWRDS